MPVGSPSQCVSSVTRSSTRWPWRTRLAGPEYSEASNITRASLPTRRRCRSATRYGAAGTGDYWKPVFYLLEGRRRDPAAQRRPHPQRSGSQDRRDRREWIAQLVEHGLIRPSFVPPPPIRRLRDLTRYRTRLVRERTREAQRLEKLLEDAGLKLSTVVSDLLGVSGRAMFTARIDGERDPQALAALADRRLGATPAALTEALHGQFSAHHATLARLMLTHIDQLTATITALDAEVDAEMAPSAAERDRLTPLPGSASAPPRCSSPNSGST
jgi:transposase